MTNDIRRIRSVDRTLRLLKSFGPNRETLTLPEAADILELHKSSASRLLRQLAEDGFLTRLADGSRYGIGIRLFEIGVLYQKSSQLFQLATVSLEALMRSTGLTSQLCVLDGAEAVVIASVESPNLIRAAANLGARLPLAVTASGRVLLMDHSPSQAAELLFSGSECSEEHLAWSSDMLESLRDTGVAIVWGEFHAELVSIAAPVRDLSGSLIASLCVVGPATEGTRSRTPVFTKAVFDQAKELSSRLRTSSAVGGYIGT